MSLKEYNMLQVKLFKELNLDMSNILEFRKICSLISIVRDFENIEEAEKTAKDIIEKNKI